MDETRSGKTKVTSVSLQAETLEAVRAIAGKQGVSSFIEQAIQQELHRRGIRELLDAMTATHGPIDRDELKQRMAEWDNFHMAQHPPAEDAA